MIQLNFYEKLQTLFDIIKSSSLFITLSILSVSLIALVLIGYIINKKVNGKLFIASWISTIIFIGIKYYKELIHLSDNLVEEVLSAIYFPNLTVYLIMIVTINIICLYTLIKNKYFIHKISSITAATLIDSIFILIMDTIVKNDINVYEKLTVYSNKDLLTLIELTSGIYTIWALVTGFTKLVNMTVKENVPVTIEEEKTIPEYVIPTPVDMVPLYNSTNYEPVNNITYTIPQLDGKELYEMFNRGENLNIEQYKILKNYLMTK